MLLVCLIFLALQLIFAMKNFIQITVVCFLLTVNVNSHTTGWTSWADCPESESCFRKRNFTCDAGEGLECLNKTNGAFEQLAENCSASPECLENITKMFQTSEVCMYVVDFS